MTTRILIPLDGSCCAERALCCATALGAQLPAEFVLFRAISIPPHIREALDGAGVESDASLEAIEANASAYVKSVAQRLSPNDGPGVCSVVRRGPAADAIVDYARQADVQMIVMASKDYGSTKRRTHGSVAERVVRTAGIPVLLVHAQGKSPCNTRPTACERILVPLDGTSTAEQILTPATAVTRALGCEMILFQASFAFLFDCSTQAAERMAKTYLAGVAERLEREKIKVSTAVETGPVAETITEFADTHQVDMIAMSTHARAGISRFALGSVAAQVRHMASTPIMLVRAA